MALIEIDGLPINSMMISHGYVVSPNQVGYFWNGPHAATRWLGVVGVCVGTRRWWVLWMLALTPSPFSRERALCGMMKLSPFPENLSGGSFI